MTSRIISATDLDLLTFFATEPKARDEDDEILDSLWALRDKRRRSDPSFLQPLLGNESAAVLEELAVTLGYFRHPSSKVLLRRRSKAAIPLCKRPLSSAFDNSVECESLHFSCRLRRCGA
jgi:hypothetical protein